MPEVTIEGVGTFEVDEGTRLVRAIEAQGVDIGHRCGGHSSCTTCRVEFEDGEPDVMTEAEFSKLNDIGQYGDFRLACQIVVDRDMTVKPLMTATDQGWDDAGPEPAITVEPETEWFPIETLEANRASGDDAEAEDTGDDA
jgi:ferredoxin